MNPASVAVPVVRSKTRRPGPPPGRKKPDLSRQLEHARRVWYGRGHRDQFAASIEALGGLSALPLVIGGVQRGVVRSWMDGSATKRHCPRPGTLRRVLAGLITVAQSKSVDSSVFDLELYSAYFRV